MIAQSKEKYHSKFKIVQRDIVTENNEKVGYTRATNKQ